MALTSPGIGSGLDINGLVSQLMSLERRPLATLDNREAGLQARLSAYGTIKGALSSLQTAAQALKDAAKFSAMKATAADTTILAASADAGAAAGSYNIEVQNLAQSQKLISSGSASTETIVGNGTLTIEFGTYSAGTFTANADKGSTTVTIDDSNHTLEGIRDAINDANAGVTATIVNDGSAYRLVVSSNSTGASHALKVTVADDDGNHTDTSGLSALAYNAATGEAQNLSETVAARNATIKIDTVTISKDSNVITDAIEGVTLTLAKENAGSTTKLTVARDTSGVKTAIDAFVKAYNDVAATIKNVTAYNAEAKKASVLTGDTTARAVESQLRALLNAPISGAPAGLTTLSDIGINFQKDGTLSVDSATLQAALDDPAKSVSTLFASETNTTGYAAQIDSLVAAMLNSDGLIAGRTDGIDSSIKVIGKQREALALRLEQIEKRYRAQFTALDSMIASMTKTSTFLQQQLANLPKAGD